MQTSSRVFNTISNTFHQIFLVLGISVFLILLIHYAIGGARIVKHTVKGVKTGAVARAELRQSPVFANYDQYDDYFADSEHLKMGVLPYYHWRKEPFEGKVIHVGIDGTRKTIKNPSPGAKKVFMFGGSALWGTGSPDKYTIPSQLQALLGSDYDVYNFGESAFVSIQELNLLLEQLANGAKPDIVIFYDGPVDIYTGLYSPGRPRHPQFSADDYTSKESTSYLLWKLAEKTNYIAITERIKMLKKQDPLSQWETNVLPNIEMRALQTIRQYAHFMKQTKALGKEYGFEVYHFWQPVLLTESRKLTDYEQKIVDATSVALIKSYQVLPSLIQQELSQYPNFYNIIDAFKETDESIYFDFCHVGPKGNEIVAQAIYQALVPGNALTS